MVPSVVLIVSIALSFRVNLLECIALSRNKQVPHKGSIYFIVIILESLTRHCYGCSQNYYINASLILPSSLTLFPPFRKFTFVDLSSVVSFSPDSW